MLKRLRGLQRILWDFKVLIRVLEEFQCFKGIQEVEGVKAFKRSSRRVSGAYMGV